MKSDSPLVLILGAGINGCALARELALNGLAVWVVDSADVASGATAGSTRLIHGGLRYLEYGEFDLVRESLAERTRLLRLAPQFVQPLRLWIPAQTRFGGLMGAVGKFFGWRRWPQSASARGRGAMLVRAGLALYHAFAHDPHWPRHRVQRSTGGEGPPFDSQRYRWLCSYYDAQVTFPERLCVAMLDDARAIAARQGLEFRVLTHHRAELQAGAATIHPCAAGPRAKALEVRPAAVVNATGAWVDETLAALHVPHSRLIGGTKGSHLFTFNPRLRQALGGEGVYAEAADGRPIFITPLGECVLVGTTDERWEGPPQDALATQAELQYLLDAVAQILPQARLDWADVAFHCCAVRPLPFVHSTSTAAITRRHALVVNDAASVPLLSVVGGKLTTMRSLAETTAAVVLERLGRKATVTSQNRIIPGGEDYPRGEAPLERAKGEIVDQTGYSAESVAAVWRLAGSRTADILAATDDHTLLPDTDLPRAFVRRVIETEWVQTLSDLVERRLMLLYHQRLTQRCLAALAAELAAAGRLAPGDVVRAVADESAHLAARYGRRVE